MDARSATLALAAVTSLACPCVCGQTLERTNELELEASLAEAKKAEVALEQSLEELRARRLALEAAISSRPRDAEPASPEAEVAAARIVNGVLTFAFPATAAVISGQQASSAGSHCTGTLIGPRTVLTANHCVERSRDPDEYFVFFQHAGVYAVDKISSQHPEYAFPHADLAVLRLGSAVDGIRPVPLNRDAVAAGTAGTLVGFGRSGGLNFDYGIKRQGRVRTAVCDRPEPSLLCWDFAAPVGLPGEDSNTCNADSGGPLFIDSGDGILLAGVTSGGTLQSCLQGDHSYDVDVRQFLSWIEDFAGSDIAAGPAPAIPVVGDDRVRVFGDTRPLAGGQSLEYRLTLEAGLQNLRLGLNGEDSPSTNLDLLVHPGAIPQEGGADCEQRGSGNYAFCEFAQPAGGGWFVRVENKGTATATFQLVATLVAP